MSPKLALLQFKFEDFEGLSASAENGQHIWSKKLKDSHGNAWKIGLYPRGARSEDWVSIYLMNAGTNDVRAKYTFITRNASGDVHNEKDHDNATWFFTAGGDGRGKAKLIKRSEIFNEKNNILSDGALVLDVHLQVIERGSLHKPSGSVLTKMLQLLENTDNADVYFKVGDEVVTSHKLIRSMNAPVLFEFCGENNDGSPVAIDDTSAEIFRIILRYVYGEEIPKSKIILDKGKDIISAADRFGIVGLKLAVEAVLVESSVVRSHTVADWLVFADSKTCPLLKEQATAYFASRSADILKCESSKLLKESPKLLTELMIEISESSNDSHFSGGRNASVDEMRKKLHERGLDVDGSKEILLSRLQESNKRKRFE